MIKPVIRNPSWQVTIQRPDFTKTTIAYQKVPDWSSTKRQVTRVTFGSSPDYSSQDNAYTDLIGYSYSNSIADPTGPFSLTLVPRSDSRGLTWKEKIKIMDIIYIREFGEVRYVGFVQNVKYSSSMSSDGKPNRSINISGLSPGGMIQKYNLNMNLYLWYNQGQTADSLNTELVDALSSKATETQDLEKILSTITDKFFKVVFGSQELKGFILWIKELVKFSTNEMKSFYPRLFQVFQVDSNNLWDIYREVLTYPVYEIFGKLNIQDGVYEINCRETPFDADDWLDLRNTVIDPLHLISHDFSTSANQVYTHYYSSMPSGEFSETENYARADLDTISVFDDEKLPIYGYNQMQASFTFFDSNEGEKKQFSSKDFLKDNSLRMYNWFVNNDKFENGEITIMTVPDKKSNKYPDIGETVSYLGGQFYVEGYSRSMGFPSGGMKTTLKVTRGYRYGKTALKINDTIQLDSSGGVIYTPQIGPIRNVSDKLIKVEKEVILG